MGWYDIEVDVVTAPLVPTALLVPNTSGNVQIRWDGALLGQTVPLTGVGVPMITGPVLFAIPAEFLQRGSHQLEIRFVANPSMTNVLRETLIGPIDVLQRRYAQKRVTLVYLPLILAVASIIVALIFFAAYRRDKTASGVGWLTAGIVAASIAILGLYLSTPEWTTPIVARVRPAAFQFSFLFFLFALNQMQDQYRRTGYAFTVVYIGFAVAMVVVPTTQVYSVASIWVLVSFALGLFLLARTLQLAFTPPRHIGAVVPVLAVTANIVHDSLGFGAGGKFWADQTLSQFNPPLLAFALVFLWVSRTRQHIESVTELNQELEDRVAQKHEELESNYARLNAANRREAVLDERERVMREMHDGLGSQLVSTLALVESGQYSSAEIEAALRDSLDDLRLMVHSLDQKEATLTDLLALVRERIEPRISRQGMRFRWRVEDLENAQTLDPETASHVLRIVQESLSNVIKHARASTITIASGSASRGAYLYIEDDGCGISIRDDSIGRGLVHMDARAEQIGGELSVKVGDSGKGTRITLWLPAAQVRT